MVDKMIEVSYVDGWQNILARELTGGLWQSSEVDIAEYVPKVETSKMAKLMNSFFDASDEDLSKWLMMVKSVAKPPVDAAAHAKVQLPQTILYSEQSPVTAKYSAMHTRLYEVVRSMLRPNISFNNRDSPADHEVWFNSCQGLRDSCEEVIGVEGDITCYDRSQEHMMLLFELTWYRRHGLSRDTLHLWEQTHGVKRALSMMYGVVMYIVLQGVSGIFKTLFRNGLMCWGAVIYALDLRREDIISLDIVGDDFLAELSRRVCLERALDVYTLTCNFTVKLGRPEVLGICSREWIYVRGWWYFVVNPVKRIESVSRALVVNAPMDQLEEKWRSLVDDLRHYDDALVMEVLAEAVKKRYALVREPRAIIRALATMAYSRSKYFASFGPEEVVLA